MKYRSGRITASQLYQVVHTNPHAPSLLLLCAVCYPATVKFTTKAYKYGCKHEKDAVKVYKERMQGRHNKLNITPAEFVVSTKKPIYIGIYIYIFGASPDSFLDCTCFGKGVLEVKCPYCVQSSSLDDAAQKPSFRLTKLSNGNLTLRKDHQYYYQCQLQLMVTERAHCDFVVWTPNELHTQRI